jgi:hypothetical protein
VLWLGTYNAGVIRFDGRTFQTLDHRDGLPTDSINGLWVDKDSVAWIATTNGLVRFAPDRTPLLISIAQISADETTYSSLPQHLSVPAGVKQVAFDFHAISFKTRPGGMLYYYQLNVIKLRKNCECMV